MSARTAILTAFLVSTTVLPVRAQDAPRPAAAQEKAAKPQSAAPADPGPEAPAPSRGAGARPQTRPVAQQQWVSPGEPAPWPPGRYPGPQGVSVRVVQPEEVAQQASCVLQIEADAAYNPYGGGTAAIDARTAASVLRSTPVLEAAVKQAPGGAGLNRRIQDWLVVNAVPTGPRFLEVEVILLKGDPGNEMDDARASKILASLCKALEGALSESADGQRQHAEKRRAKVEQDVTAARERLNAVRAKLRQYRNETAALGQQGGDARYALNNLRNQRQQYEQQLASYRARLKALQPSTSPLVAEWRGVVELRQKQLDEARELAAAGKAAKESVQAQERRLEEAKSQLEVARRTAAVEADQTRGRGTEIASIEANLAQTESQLKTVNDQLAKLEDPKTIEMLEEIPELQNEENRARNELTEATSRADQIRRTLDVGGEISVRVLDGKPDQ